MLELLASDYRLFVQDVLAWAMCLAALRWGGGPERAVAATWLVLFEIVDRIYHLTSDAGYLVTDVDVFHASLDVTAGIAWIAIALFANRNYPLWIAGMQVLAMTAHLARGMAESISPIAYIMMTVAPGWFQLLFLAIGLTRHIFRQRKYGQYRDWRITRNWPEAPVIAGSKRKITAGLASGNRTTGGDL